MSNDGFQLAFHNWEHVRPRFKKVFEICGGKSQHFPCAVDAIEIIAVAGLRHFGPALEVAQFLFRFLRKQVVSKPEGKFSISVQFVHNAVVVRIILKSAAGINDTGDSKTVELTEKEPGRVELVLARKFRPLGQGGVENIYVRLRDEKTRGIPVTVALNFTGRKIRGVLVITHRSKRRSV